MTSQLRFGLLGPVQAWQGERELELGSPQQRAVLAALLLSKGKHVAVDDLVEMLWEHNMPRSARATVRTYICRLRRELTRAAGEAAEDVVELRSAGGGYQLTVDPASVDVWIFRANLAAARQAHGQGGLGDADHQLRGALALWRGAPLAGLAGSFFDGQRAGLEQLHSTATEEQLAVRIALGEHADAAAELAVRVAEQPYRERLWELLMLSLYRSGRQAEALATYREVAALLMQELGLEPGPGLRDLHSRILTSDATLVQPARPVDRPIASGEWGHDGTVTRIAAPASNAGESWDGPTTWWTFPVAC
ncbi:MAG TPA: AfsR/SARP family transcriptional regulator [Pseudonocardia sp.]|jgi:DNA-binding SARP family transcriptional activator|nr:AfsR/SARP family transcriptional regulator [Pseudonocardia sp.]